MLTIADLCSRLSFRVIQYPCCIGLHYSLDIGAMRMVGCRQRAMDTMSSRQSEFSQAILARNLVSESILYLRSLTGTISSLSSIVLKVLYGKYQSPHGTVAKETNSENERVNNHDRRQFETLLRWCDVVQWSKSAVSHVRTPKV